MPSISETGQLDRLGKVKDDMEESVCDVSIPTLLVPDSAAVFPVVKDVVVMDSVSVSISLDQLRGLSAAVNRRFNC